MNHFGYEVDDQSLDKALMPERTRFNVGKQGRGLALTRIQKCRVKEIIRGFGPLAEDMIYFD